MATHFPLLSYHVDTSHWTFQEAQDVGFTKMYGRNCHPSGTGFRSGPWTESRPLALTAVHPATTETVSVVSTTVSCRVRKDKLIIPHRFYRTAWNADVVLR